jgi:hypothetical protein
MAALELSNHMRFHFTIQRVSNLGVQDRGDSLAGLEASAVPLPPSLSGVKNQRAKAKPGNSCRC